MSSRKPRKQGQRPQKKKQKPRRTKNVRGESKRRPKLFGAVAKMLTDPCNSVLMPGVHTTSEGVLNRFKTVTHPSNAAADSGYIVWFPDYSTSEFGTAAFLWEATSTTQIPANNNVGNWYGRGYSYSTAESLDVGAANFINTDTCNDFRLVSACIRVTYTGTLLDSKGIVSTIENLTADQLLLGHVGEFPSTTDDILQSATKTSRMGTETHEVRSRPNPALNGHFKSTRDSIITRGNNAKESIIGGEALRFAPTGIGFSWSGVKSTDLRIEFIQNIEWRPKVSSGMAISVPKQITQEGYISQVLMYLDTQFPGWSTRAATSAFGIGLSSLGI